MSKRVAIVTGASSGIGFDTVKRLLSSGFVVYAGARRLEKMKPLEKLGANIYPLDVTSKKSIKKFMKRVNNNETRIDVLVNNAGYGSYGAIEDVSIKEAKHQLEVNLLGVARLIKLVVPTMRKRGRGKIINISSVAGKVHTPFGGWYNASKFGLEGLSDALRMELQPFGIDVVVIEPGGVKTEWGKIAASKLEESSAYGAYAKQAKAIAKRMAEYYNKGNLTHPSVIARTIVRSVNVRRPKTRYTVGYLAKPAVTLRWLLPDRMFDNLIRKFL